MATHSSVLAWTIPGTGETSGVAQSPTRLKRLSSSSSKFADETGNSKLVLWDNPEGGGGEGGGRGVQDGGTHVHPWLADSCRCMAKKKSQYCKVISLQLK